AITRTSAAPPPTGRATFACPFRGTTSRQRRDAAEPAPPPAVVATACQTQNGSAQREGAYQARWPEPGLRRSSPLRSRRRLGRDARRCRRAGGDPTPRALAPAAAAPGSRLRSRSAEHHRTDLQEGTLRRATSAAWRALRP